MGDTRHIMDSHSEIARRRRERQLGEGGAGIQAEEVSLRRSASERKRVELTSGQLRSGMHLMEAPHDDGRGSPGPAEGMPGMHARNQTEKLMDRNLRHLRPASA